MKQRILSSLVVILLLASLLAVMATPAQADPPAAGIDLTPDDSLILAVDPPELWRPETIAESAELGIEWMLAQVSAYVEDTRGLEFIREVPVKKITREQFIEEELTQEPIVTSDFNNLVMDALHLLPKGMSAAEVTTEFLGSSVLAYYDYSDGTMTYIDGEADELEMRATLAHELTHALVHQHFPDAYKALSSASSSDAHFASLSVFEGDATLVASDYYYGYSDKYSDTVKSLSLPFFPNVVFSARLPSIKTQLGAFQLWSYFPYYEGVNFVYDLFKKKARSKDPWTEVNKAYSNLPQTTEQIVHPKKYPKEGAIAITVPTPTSGYWRVLGRDSLGEAALFVMFYGQGLAKLGTAHTYNSPLSAGWGGDEFVGYKDAAGQLGYTWVIEMDTAADAKALLKGYEKMMKSMNAKPGDGLWNLGDQFLKISLAGKKQVMIASAPSAKAVAQLWPGPSFSVLSPNGGEDWQIGTTETITWTSDGVDAKAKVKIELSLDGGKKWKSIIPSTPNDGSQDWKVKGKASTEAMIRVIGVKSKDILDSSDDTFTISKP